MLGQAGHAALPFSPCGRDRPDPPKLYPSMSRLREAGMTTATTQRLAPGIQPAHPGRAARVDSLVLAAVPSAIGCARLFTIYTLACWCLDNHTIDTAEQVAGELVTHAVETTGITDGQPFYDAVYDDLTCIRIQLRLVDHNVFINVWDCDCTPPVVDANNRPADAHLRNVVQASQRAGYTHPVSGGKSIWCQLVAHPAWPVPDMLATSQPNLNLMWRVLNGLRKLNTGHNRRQYGGQ